ncbi:GMC family oxidoreductase [Actinoplanes teichomyceticus]|uniref:Choline dehydrogenase-like flavoprotein n=1 Tax=Actinoplanes teichomyceticus TaxID=1867 RepID=A0A561WBX3_ACTTI|nr:GMC family oxidoreductase N-terminal domain-containing protein [Actinoplanes teichomyceticus]TWG21345.1 choline dehydrogenase-like flavoprotein [Actinoplanes teichomyceticus]GIF16430.1 choline dehydrogenase [Actinoplanes teichomyceticus]
MYDYIIVGAGSAGCVLAARLSEDPGVRVCLVEAGPADTADNIHVPVAFGQLFRTELDWDYDTHEEPALDRRRVYLPRGRVLGGTSSTNTMIYIRGARNDFDGWQQPGWSFDEMLPYFKRSEDNERGASAYHGTGGPLAVSDPRTRNPMSTAFVEAAGQAGYGFNDDFNGPTQDGFGFFQLTQRDGRRASTATAFLHPAADRPNLTVLTHVRVHRVLIENGRAVGVTGTRLDETLTLHAEREVIVAAGAYNSPQLLMLSGVGPAPLLSGFGVPVLADLPEVGQNLQDHALIPLVYTHAQPISLIAAGTPEDLAEFTRHGRGPMTANGPQAGGFVRTSEELSDPDVEFLAAPVMFADSGLGTPTHHALSFGPSMIAPRSRGSVSLALPDPTAKPRIVHNYFTDERDLDDAVHATRIALRIAGQKALATFTEGRHAPPASDSDDDLRAYVRQYAHSIYHPGGTCAMGAVVDDQLRVYGIDGLRVVDASVLPTMIRGNPNAPVIAIAEKAADLIAGRTPLPVEAVAAVH